MCVIYDQLKYSHCLRKMFWSFPVHFQNYLLEMQLFSSAAEQLVPTRTSPYSISLPRGWLRVTMVTAQPLPSGCRSGREDAAHPCNFGTEQLGCSISASSAPCYTVAGARQSCRAHPGGVQLRVFLATFSRAGGIRPPIPFSA